MIENIAVALGRVVVLLMTAGSGGYVASLFALCAYPAQCLDRGVGPFPIGLDRCARRQLGIPSKRASRR